MLTALLRPSSKLLAALAIAALLVVVDGTPAIAAAYPPKVEKVYLAGCTKVAASTGNIGKAKAKTYCKTTLKCLEANLPYKTFVKLNAHPKKLLRNAAVKACIKQGVAAIS